MNSIEVKTRERCQMVNITSQVRDAVKDSGVTEGMCLVYCPHTTGGITINENADPDVVRDLLMALNRVAPSDWPYQHSEGNSDAHLKSSLVGCSEQVLINNGDLVLGTWQSVYFCEFDGPRSRTVHIGIIPER
ncbi:MAG: secondary thiamine-phosphate synthase enzyme YjbQ [Candidatus Sumerlaeia bacterium]